MRKKIAALAVALSTFCWVLPVAAQDSVAQFYRGKTITIVVGSSAGGGYDAYARLMARYFGKYVPGAPNVTVTNMLGAGSEVAAAYVAHVAAKDGTFIAAPNSDLPLDQILGDATNVNYDPSRVSYLGSAVSDDYVCMVRPDAPATSFEDMFKTPVIMGGTAANAASGYLPILLNNVFGTKFKVVLGYPGAREITMAMQKNEVQGVCLGWLSLKSLYPYLLKGGEVKIAVQEDDKGLPEVNKLGVPLAVSHAHDEQQRRILEIVNSQEVFARPYFVAHEVPADRLESLRHAFIETWRDPELLKEAAKVNEDVSVTSAEDVQALLRKIYASPPALLKSAKDAIQAK